MADDRDPHDALEELLARALPGVRRMPREERQRVAKRPPPRRRPGTPPPAARRRRGGFTVERWGEVVTGLADGADARWLDRLRAGAVPADAEIDLHGRTAAASTVAVDALLARARAAGHRCLRIVHGRGRRSADGPVLKEAMVAHLSARGTAAGVLAFATAPAEAGGAGALLVLLEGSGGG